MERKVSSPQGNCEGDKALQSFQVAGDTAIPSVSYAIREGVQDPDFRLLPKGNRGIETPQKLG